MQYAESILDLVGHTPLVRITRVVRDLGPTERQPLLLAKLEMLNPGGSVKDRIGLPMIEAAERAGLLKPGGTIIEPTSGNTGHGLAIAAALKGYRCIFVMADKQSVEKQTLLRAYGAEVVLCPTNVDPESPESYYSVAARLARDIPGAFKPDQYWNAENPLAHERTTGPELWEQTEGRLTHFVAGVGTGGTISGTAHYLKAQDPTIQIVGADPEGSVLSGDVARPYLTEGIGEDFVPGTYDPAVIDRWVRVSDRDAFAMARRLTREEGILSGGSCGTAMVAAREVVRDLASQDGGHRAVVVVLLPDSGRSYLSKVYNDEWLRANGLMATTGATTRIEVLLADRHHAADRPAVVVARTTQRVGDAIAPDRAHLCARRPRADGPAAGRRLRGEEAPARRRGRLRAVVVGSGAGRGRPAHRELRGAGAVACARADGDADRVACAGIAAGRVVGAGAGGVLARARARGAGSRAVRCAAGSTRRQGVRGGAGDAARRRGAGAGTRAALAARARRRSRWARACAARRSRVGAGFVRADGVLRQWPVATLALILAALAFGVAFAPRG